MESGVDTGVVKAEVVGGKEVSVCQYPSTVRVEDCTGTLIHPRIITTAAHCVTDGTETIRFGGGSNDPGTFTLTGRCTAGARGQSGVGSNKDWAYCVLPEDERVKKLPITPPLVGCEAERFLKPDSSAWIVGYGTTGPSGQGSGVKRAVEVKVNRVGNGTIDVGDREVGACHGDSGGPIYMQLSDGANDYGLRVFGSTSGPGASFCDCNCSTVYVDIAMHIKAIEENEDIDVTPCTDAQGNWAPGPDCNALQTQAMNGSGTFPNCMVARTTAPISSCTSAAGSGAAGATAGSAAMPNAGMGGAPRAGTTALAGSGGTAAAGTTASAAAGRGGTAAAGNASEAGRDSASVSPAIAGRSGTAGSTAAVSSSTQAVSAAGSAGGVANTPERQSSNGGCSCSASPLSDAASGGWMLFCGALLLTRHRTRSKRARA